MGLVNLSETWNFFVEILFFFDYNTQAFILNFIKMISFVVRSLLIWASNTAVLYFTSLYFSKELWFMLHFQQWFHLFLWDTYNVVWIILLWFIFWFVNEIVWMILKVLTLPVRFLTLWLSNIIVNIWLLYLIQYLVNYVVNIGFTIQLWTIWQTFVLSIFISILSGLVHFIIKKLM